MAKYFNFEGPRALLMEAALDFLNENPSAKLSMASLARQAKTSKVRIAYHFSGTDEVLIEVAKSWAFTGHAATTQVLEAAVGLPPFLLLEKILDATILWEKSYPKVARLTPLLIHHSRLIPEIKMIQNKAMEVGLVRIENLLKNGIKKELPEEEVKASAIAIHNMIIGTFILNQVLSSTQKDDQWKAIRLSIQKTIENLLN